jgi:diguanylate cyclase (GGDEF)-like protein/PAS domain S-box-containing protein
MSEPGHERKPQRSTADGTRAREVLAGKWSYLLSGIVAVPLDRKTLDRELREQLAVLCGLVGSARFDAEPAERVGARLVELGCGGEASLRCTADVLGKGLLALPEFQPVDRFAERAVLVLGALASGFVAANQRAVFEQQESVQLSLLKAIRDAKWNLQESEARFEEVATASASGIVLVGLDERIVRANTAFADILGRSAAEVNETPWCDLVHPDSVQAFRDSMALLLTGEQERIRQPLRLLRKDGDVVRISLTASLLSTPDGEPSHFIGVFEDGTELMLLQAELSRQALHDVLTGLPNRQFFGTRLERAALRADPAHGITLFLLELDAFGLVSSGLGSRVAERLLVHVAQRLKVVLAEENAVIARFDGAEFAILLENSPTTPEIATIVAKINTELAEPTYMDGHGLAVSASFGVVHPPSPGLEPAVLLEAAARTLRRAKEGRRGQWKLFDAGPDAEERRSDVLAVVMPGAWERGEISVLYRPVIHVADGRIAGVEALLRWDRPGLDPLPHERCLELAEQTGLILSLGESLLGIAARQAEWWRLRLGFELPLSIGLTAHQATDADLVARVARVLDDTGLSPGSLTVRVPAGLLPMAGTFDNLTALAALGIHIGLEGFGQTPGELAAVAGLPVGSVRVTGGPAERSGAALVDALVEFVHEAGMSFTVDGVDTGERAGWWRARGADMATGELFGGACPADEVVAFFGDH